MSELNVSHVMLYFIFYFVEYDVIKRSPDASVNSNNVKSSFMIILSLVRCAKIRIKYSIKRTINQKNNYPNKQKNHTRL